MGAQSRGCDKSASVAQEEMEMTVSKWTPMTSTVKILGACVFVSIVLLFIFSVHSNLCLQRSIGELRHDLDLYQEEINRQKIVLDANLNGYGQQAVYSNSNDSEELDDEYNLYDEEDDEGEDEEERDTSYEELSLILDEKSTRIKRDVSNNSTTIKPPRERSDKRKKSDRGSSRRRDRGRERVRHDRKKESSRKGPKTPLSVMHFESYVADEQWKQVADGQIHEIPYLHGTLSQDGFLPLSHTYQFWSLPDWCKHGVRFASYEDSTGQLRINEAGVYYVYSQVMYHDLTGSYAYGIYVNEELQFQCMVTRRVEARDREMGARHAIYEQCYTGGAIYLAKGQRVSIRNVYLSLRPKTLLNLDHSTFWGIFRLDG